MHSGSLDSTQLARGALSYRLVRLLRIFRALQTSRVHPSRVRYRHAKHEQILKHSDRTDIYQDSSRLGIRSTHLHETRGLIQA